MKTTFKIINGNLYEYDSKGNLIHLKDSSGVESWREFDSNGNLIHFKDSDGYERWAEHDSNGKLNHFKNSDGYETWCDSNGKNITKKQFDKLKSSCDGKKYQLKLI